MKKRTVSILIAAMVCVTAACGAKGEEGQGGEEEAVTKDSGPEKILEEANSQYGKQSLRGSDCTYTYCYSDGSTQEETGVTVFDAEKGIQQMVYRQGDTVVSQVFNVKDGDAYYTYSYDEEDGSWIRFQQVADDNGETSYQREEDGELFVFQPSYGYDNVKYSQEGEEKINGVDTIKIKVTADEAVSRDEEDDGITKEDVLSSYGLTEEAVGYIEGLEEELDQYVQAMNQAAYGSTTSFENTIWVDAQDFIPVKSESVTTFHEVETVDDTGEDPLADFENHYWKAAMVQEDMDNGMSLSEALEDVKNNESGMEEQQKLSEEEQEETQEEEDDEPQQVSMIAAETYVYGDDCMEIGELPGEYEEITEEDYMYGEY